MYRYIMDSRIEAYVNSLNDSEKKTLIIARDHLGTSFDIEKSIGFLEYIQKHSK